MTFQLRQPDISVDANHYSCICFHHKIVLISNLLSLHQHTFCATASQIVHATLHTALVALHSLRAPQKQRVSSIVALHCKQTQDQGDFNPVMVSRVLRSSGRQQQQANCPQNLLAYILPCSPRFRRRELWVCAYKELQMRCAARLPT